MTLSHMLAVIATITAVAMGALFAAGIHLVPTDPNMGALAMIAGMLTAIPLVATAMLAIEARQFGTLS